MNNFSYKCDSYHQKIHSVKSVYNKLTDVADFLYSNDVITSLLLTVTQLTALQKSCYIILPIMFHTCNVMNFISGQLVLGTPNAALATKLKQYLPKLRKHLLNEGWQINSIRIKIQIFRTNTTSNIHHKLFLSNSAISTFTKLYNTLHNTTSNQSLKAALLKMISKNNKYKK